MKRRETKGAILALCLAIAIVTFVAFMWTTSARDAGAFSGAADAAGSCTTCHSFTTGTGGPEHAAHLGRGTACTACHGTAGFNPNPPTSACGACHLISPPGSNTGTGLTCINATHKSTCQSCHGACPTPPEVCTGGLDEDNDGLFDCNDPDCNADPACAPNAEVCTGGIDEDGDGLFDCADPDCNADPACAPNAEVCTGGIDEDNDGLVDCADPDCAGNPVCPQPPGPPADHTVNKDGALHKEGYQNPTQTGCIACHGADLKGGIVGVSCFSCHGRVWAQNGLLPVSHTVKRGHTMHKPGLKEPFTYKCTDCHGADLRGSNIAPSCYKCHGSHWKWKDDPGGKGKK